MVVCSKTCIFGRTILNECFCVTMKKQLLFFLFLTCGSAFRGVAQVIPSDSLPHPPFTKGISVLRGEVLSPQLRGDTLLLFYNDLYEIQKIKCAVDSLGRFSLELPLEYPREFRLVCPSARTESFCFLLMPGAESRMKLTLTNGLWRGQCEGAFAPINGNLLNADLPEDLIAGMFQFPEEVKDVESLRVYLLNRYYKLQAEIEKNADICAGTRQLLSMKLEVALYCLWQDAPDYLLRAQIYSAANETTQLSTRIWTPLSKLPSLNNSMFLYCLEYPYLIERIRQTKPILDEDSIYEKLCLKGEITQKQYALVLRFFNRSQVVSATSFTKEEQILLYSCMQRKEAYIKELEDLHWKLLFGGDYSFIQTLWKKHDAQP